MGFLIYRKTVHGATATYEQLHRLRFGGRDGLIAKHVRTLSEGSLRSWKIDTASVLQLAGEADPEGTILFDVTGPESTSVCLYELIKVHGSCRDTSTQLALDFAVVMDQEIDGDTRAYARKFEAPAPEKPRLLGETLSLSGGPGGGDWKWGTPPLQIGATIVNATGGHGSGTPCANCNCGGAALK